jgi:(p)ppGpp synthase/HD superfamily hydrolase
VRAASTAASMHMPGVFPVHESWDSVKSAWAEPMLNIYCPISDWGAQTLAYRAMRDNAIRYLYPREFAETSSLVESRIPALERTGAILGRLLELMSERLNMRILVAHHYSEVSQAFPELDSRTMAVSIRPFKGIGGLLNKSIKRGTPVGNVHDWSGFTAITDTESRMYDVVAFLRNEGIAAAAKELGISDLCTLEATDYARNPKPVTRYRSVHLDTVSRDPGMVPMEAIVRTAEMHREADEGTAGHDVYKLSPLRNGERKSLMQRLDEIVSNFLASERRA